MMDRKVYQASLIENDASLSARSLFADSVSVWNNGAYEENFSGEKNYSFDASVVKKLDAEKYFWLITLRVIK